jgi:iron-sulfur cluster assembly protein
MAVTVTPTAAREICQIIRQQELDPMKIRLRVGVKGGGCSGFSYLLDLTETQRETDELWEVDYELPIANGQSSRDEAASGGVGTVRETETFTLRIVCDPKSYLYLNGTTIDFKDEVMGRGFVFNNPNATSSCGCGSSFSA